VDKNKNNDKVILTTEKEKEDRETNTKYPITLLPTSLIVCQHGLVKDPWKNEIEKIVGLKCHYVNRVTDKIDKEVFKKHDVVLCNSNKFSELAKYCDEHRLKWQRVIFDEVNAIYLPNCPSINSLFYWGVLARWNELSKIKNKGFIKSNFASLTKDVLQEMIIKVDNKDIDPRCFNFPPFIKTNVVCGCSPDHRIINECFPETKLSALMNEELFVEARDYLSNITDNFLPSSSSAGASHSILELVLKNISMNGKLGKISKGRRILGITRKIFREKMCLRCNAALTSCSDELVVVPSFSTECCHLNYCFDCCQFVDSCPICLEFLTKPLDLNTTEMLSGKNQLMERKRKIIKLVRNHYKLGKNDLLPLQYRFLEQEEKDQQGQEEK
jgi:hypothetical protein